MLRRTILLISMLVTSLLSQTPSGTYKIWADSLKVDSAGTFIDVTERSHTTYGKYLHSSAKDTIDAVIGRSPGFTLDTNNKAVISQSFLSDSLVAADTTALKLRKGASDGAVVYLAQSGISGIFIYGDSTYSEGGVQFDAPVNGKAWIRQEFKEDSKIIKSQWFPTLTKAFNLLSNGMTIKVEPIRHTVTSAITIGADSVILDFTGATIFKAESTPSTAEYAFYFSGSLNGTWYDVADSIYQSRDTLIVSSGIANFTEGTWFALYDSTDGVKYGGDYTEVNYIQKISGDTIFTAFGFGRPHPASKTKINPFSPRKNVTIKGGRFVSDYITTNITADRDLNRVYFFKFDQAVNILFDKCISDSTAGLYTTTWYTRFVDFDHCTFTNSLDDGSLYRCQNWSYSYCKAYNLDVFGIGANQSDYGSIDHCTIGTNIPLRNGIVVQNSSYVTTSYCTIVGKPLYYGISYNVECDYGKIVNNTIQGSGTYGISVSESGHVQIVQNSIFNQGEATGIHLDVAWKCDILNNLIIADENSSYPDIQHGIAINTSAGYKILLENNRVSGNYVDGMTGYQILLRFATENDTVKNTIISDNYFINAGKGLNINYDVSGTTIKNNRFDFAAGWSRTSAICNSKDSLATGDGVWDSGEIDLSTGDTLYIGTAESDASIIKYTVVFTEDIASADTVSWKLGVLSDDDVIDTDQMIGARTAGEIYYWKPYVNGGDTRQFQTKNVQRGEPIKLSLSGLKADQGKAIFRVYYMNWQ